MSHWKAGQLNLKCSLDILRRALLSIMPQWEGYIEVDEGGGLEVKDMGGVRQSGYSLKVPNDAPGCRWCDLGFKKEKGGEWTILYDPARLPEPMKDAPNVMSLKAAEINIKLDAVKRGHTLIKDTTEGDEVVIHIVVPVGQKYMF